MSAAAPGYLYVVSGLSPLARANLVEPSSEDVEVVVPSHRVANRGAPARPLGRSKRRLLWEQQIADWLHTAGHSRGRFGRVGSRKRFQMCIFVLYFIACTIDIASMQCGDVLCSKLLHGCDCRVQQCIHTKPHSYDIAGSPS